MCVQLIRINLQIWCKVKYTITIKSNEQMTISVNTNGDGNLILGSRTHYMNTLCQILLDQLVNTIHMGSSPVFSGVSVY